MILVQAYDPCAKAYTDPGAVYNDPCAKTYKDPCAKAYNDPYAKAYNDPCASLRQPLLKPMMTLVQANYDPCASLH